MILRWLAWRNASELALLIARSMASEPEAWWKGVGYCNASLGLRVLCTGEVFGGSYPEDREYQDRIETTWADLYILSEAYSALAAENDRRKDKAVRTRIMAALTANGSA